MERYGEDFSAIVEVLAVVLGSYVVAILLVAVFKLELIGISR